VEEIKRAREAAGLTLAEVAGRCGIDQPALSRLENGHNKNPTLDTLRRYAAAVGRLVLTTEAIRATRPAQGNAKPVRPARERWAALLICSDEPIIPRNVRASGSVCG